MDFTFYKFQGTGNDFIMIDDRSMTFPAHSTVINTWCDRKFGIGADGLILLQEDKDYDFRMVYFNADGNESTMCGNGGRCIAAFAKFLQINLEKRQFIAIDGPHDFVIHDDTVLLKMKDVLTIEHLDNAYVMDTGSPHYVVFGHHIAEMELVDSARKIRYNEMYKANGINVNFTEKIDQRYFIRTYERGVEDETLSCGTGTVATALSWAIKEDLSEGKIELITQGGKLNVHFKQNNRQFSDIWLEGAAEYVFKGVCATAI